ncbi:hypothetical protein CsSME_00045894 [Camellia sinensis var. sinensis]
MFGTGGSPSLRLADSGVTPLMADNGISSLFAMEGNQMSFEDKVFYIKFPTDGANCTGSKYSAVLVLLSSKLCLYPIDLRTQRHHAYILSAHKSAPASLLTRGAAFSSVSTKSSAHHLTKPPDNISGNSTARRH